MAAERADQRYCCSGCETVAHLLSEEGLGRYYELAPGPLPPVGAIPTPATPLWLDPLIAQAESGPGAVASLTLDVRGIHCAACVWLISELFRRRRGGVSITVNPALGKAQLYYRRGELDVATFVQDVERFGYQLGPPHKTTSRARNGLTLRLGICAALTMNVMLFSISVYLGMSPADGALYPVFGWLGALLSTIVAVVGGSHFLRSTWIALRHRVLHLDLPIALGIVLVYVTSVLRLIHDPTDALGYFDTLCTFVTLMLAGRFIQQSIIDRNRRFLLEDDGGRDLFVRRLEPSGPISIPAASVRAGDRLLISPGELLPVAARATTDTTLSLDWITGESHPQELAADALLPAGSFNAGRSAFVAVAEQALRDSPLPQLLRAPVMALGPRRHLRFWDRLARTWVLQVFAAAIAGLWLWWPQGAGPALDVAVAILVVTCPCAIGLALPLAHEIVGSRLRRAGFVIRAGDLLDRLDLVRTVIFDKTGTLTLGHLSLDNEAALAALPVDVRDVAFNLAGRSGHPVAACLSKALARLGARWQDDAVIVETPGAGLAWTTPDGTCWKLGRASWATSRSDTVGTALSRDGQLVASFEVKESLRPGAARDLATLSQAGYRLHLLSGDKAARVATTAATVGIPAANARGELRPEDKAAIVKSLGEGTLYLGDGINDSLAFDAALAAGTVATARPVLPGKSAFLLLGEGLSPLTLALTEARRLRRVVRRVIVLSLSYNVLAISTCLLGLMSPLRAAVSMPISSVTLVLLTLLQLREKRAPQTPASASELLEVTP